MLTHASGRSRHASHICRATTPFTLINLLVSPATQDMLLATTILALHFVLLIIGPLASSYYGQLPRLSRASV